MSAKSLSNVLQVIFTALQNPLVAVSVVALAGLASVLVMAALLIR